jgi:hypothetical protein
MQQFEQDWLELGSRVARSLHYQHPRNLRHLQAIQAKAGGDRPARPEVNPGRVAQQPSSPSIPADDA